MEVLNCTFRVKTINLQKIEIKEGDHQLSTTALTHVECVWKIPVDSSVNLKLVLIFYEKLLHTHDKKICQLNHQILLAILYFFFFGN